jgi:hypothetical protein
MSYGESIFLEGLFVGVKVIGLSSSELSTLVTSDLTKSIAGLKRLPVTVKCLSFSFKYYFLPISHHNIF